MEKNLDARSRAIVGNIRQLLGDLRTQGLSNDEIIGAIGLSKEPICLILTYSGLMSKDGSIRIHLNPMERSLYRLFLNHPEGIRICDMWQFYSEFLGYYCNESVEDKDRIIDTIDNLCEKKEAIFPIISRIKKKVTDSLGSEAAESVIIRRQKDGCYRISKKQSIV